MHYAAKQNEKMPYKMHILCFFHFIKKYSDCIAKPSRNHINHTSEANLLPHISDAENYEPECYVLAA